MVQMKVFKTDGSSTSGTATDILTNLDFWQPLRDITIINLTQASCGTVANDADWDIYANGKQTDYSFRAEELNPANQGGRSVVAPDGVRIKAGTIIQFKWKGQALATTNYLSVYYM